jgi:hypothetical protein
MGRTLTRSTAAAGALAATLVAGSALGVGAALAGGESGRTGRSAQAPPDVPDRGRWVWCPQEADSSVDVSVDDCWVPPEDGVPPWTGRGLHGWGWHGWGMPAGTLDCANWPDPSEWPDPPDWPDWLGWPPDDPRWAALCEGDPAGDGTDSPSPSPTVT